MEGNVFELFAKLFLDTSGYENDLKKAGGSMEGFGGKLKTGLATAAKVGAAAIGAATTAVVGFAAASVKTGQSFDTSMSQVAATMGKSMDELNSMVGTTQVGTEKFSGTLREFAQYMGKTTAFSASQAADALNYMALAGYDAQKSMDMLPKVLNLAAAGGMDLAMASDMVTDASSALGLEMDETGALIDKMAQASSKSNTSVAQLGEAILTVGGTAKNLAGGTTELSTALGILADSGTKGAEGGTALRNIILSLSAPTEKAADQMLALGLEVYDAEGKMRPLNDIFKDLNGVLSTMTQGEQTNVLNTLFNKVDLKSANALLENCSERWDKLSASIDKSKGAAEKRAKTQLDNLEGDITKFKSAMEGAQILISDKLSPSLRKFVQFGTEGVGKITDAFEKNGLKGAMQTLGEVVSTGITNITKKLPEAIDAGYQLLEAVAGGIVQNLPAIATSAVQAVSTLAQNLSERLPDIINAGLEMIHSLSEGLVSGVPDFLSNALPVITDFTAGLRENAGKFVDEGLEMLLSLAQGLMDGLPALIAYVPEIVTNIAGIINDNAPKVLAAGVKLIVVLAKGLIKAIPDLIANIPQIINAIVNVITAFNWIHLGMNIIKFLGNGIKSMVASIRGVSGNIVDAIKGGFTDMPAKMAEIGKSIIEGLWEGIKAAKDWLKSQIGGVFSGIVSVAKNALGIHSPSKVFAQIGGFMAEGLGEGWDGEMAAVEKDIQNSLHFEAANVDISAKAAGAASTGTPGTGIAGDIILNVYGAQGQDVTKLAQIVMRMIQQQLDRRVAVYGTA